MQELVSVILLAAGIVNGAVVAGLLIAKRANRTNLWVLALFIGLLTVRTCIYLFGQQGVFDPHSWLYIPIFEVALAYGPCVYLYFVYSTLRGFQRADFLHFTPLCLALSYYAALLLLPPDKVFYIKENIHFAVFVKLEFGLITASLMIYLWLTIKGLSEYELWLDATLSDAENYRLDWLKTFIVGSAVFALVWFLSSLRTMWLSVGYDADFVLFVSQSILLSFLAFESWRHSDVNLPRFCPQTTDFSEPEHSQPYSEQRIEQWLGQLEKNQWWRDPSLSLSSLANRLGTNTSTLSAALNHYCGENFNAVINKMRVEFVCSELQKQSAESLLDLAYNAGFNSKNSFNRNFKRFTNMTPSQFKNSLEPQS